MKEAKFIYEINILSVLIIILMIFLSIYYTEKIEDVTEHESYYKYIINDKEDIINNLTTHDISKYNDLDWNIHTKCNQTHGYDSYFCEKLFPSN